MFKTAALFVARLSEVEKIRIRSVQTIDELEHVFQTRHAFEFNLPLDKARVEFLKAVDLVRAAFIAQSAETEFGLTWKF